MDIKAFIHQEKQITDTALEQFLQERVRFEKQIDSKLFSISQAISNQILRSGKRLRPLLMRLAYRLAQGDEGKDIVQASLYTELIHQFLLVHDDIADRDLQRYGGPTLEVVFAESYEKAYQTKNHHYGRTIAMLAGDHIRTWADLALLDSNFESAQIKAVITTMDQVIIDTLAGWNIQYQQNFQPISEASAKEFVKGMELVSARYTFEAPLKLGLILANGDTQLEEVLTDFAHHVGMAYQIQDDILGVFGDTKQTGKPVGNDLREGKKTLLVLKAFEHGNDFQRQLLTDYLGTELNAQQLQVLQHTIIETGSLMYSKELAQAHIKKAIKSLEDLDTLKQEEHLILQSLAQYLQHRNH